MTEYTDTEQISRLTAEQRNIGVALDILDNHAGTVPSCTIAATDAVPPDLPMTVAVGMTDAPQAMLSGIKAGLIQRYNEINRELAELGVTGTPPDHAGPPLVETQPA
jgi:hypothetical protein